MKKKKKKSCWPGYVAKVKKDHLAVKQLKVENLRWLIIV